METLSDEVVEQSLDRCMSCKYFDMSDFPNFWCEKKEDFINGTDTRFCEELKILRIVENGKRCRYEKHD
jgi:hypothetical protein